MIVQTIQCLIVSLIVANAQTQRLSVDQGTFVEVGSALSGQCPSQPFYLTDSQCSSGSLDDNGSSGFVFTTTNSGIDFSLNETAFKTYKFVCNDRCQPVVSYEMTIDQSEDNFGTVVLTCELRFSRSEPGSSFAVPGSFTWLKNDLIISDTESLGLDDFNSTAADFSSISRSVTLSDVEDADSQDKHGAPSVSKSIGGAYTCQFTADAATLQKVYVLEEELAVKIVMEPSKPQYGDGNDVTLTCKVSGHPVLDIVWLFNGAPLTTVASVPETKADYRSLAFSLTNLEDSVDRGNYTCMASNGFRNFTDSQILHVRDRLAPLWPFIGICVQVVVLIVFILLGERMRKSEHNKKMRKKREEMNDLTSTPSALSS